MRNFQQYISLFLTLILCVSGAHSATYKHYHSESFTTRDGLIQSDVKDILQDSHGFIWVATNGGISRFDGYEFRTFAVGDLGLKTNLILAFAEDNHGNIWIGTSDKGVFCFLRSEERFVHYSELLGHIEDPKLKSVRHLSRGPRGDIWGAENSLGYSFRLRYNDKFQKIEKIDTYNIDASIGEKAITAFEASSANIYMATNRDLYKFSVGQDKFIPVRERAPLAVVTDIHLRGEILHLIIFGRFVGLNIRTGQTSSYKLPFKPLKVNWSGGRMWFVASDGVYVAKYYPRVDRFDEIEKVDSYHPLIPQVITDDHSGGVYVGYQKEGIRRYDIDRAPFMTSKGMGNNHILQIKALTDGAILVGTEGTGGFILDSINAKPYEMPLSENRTVYSFVEDEGEIIVSTNSGVFAFKRGENKKARKIYNDNSIRQILLDGDYMWLASYSRGLLRVNRKTSQIKVINNEENKTLPTNTLRNIMLDSKSNLWVASEAGVIMVDAKERFSENPRFEKVLPDDRAQHYAIPIMESSKGDIWYGTMGYGLYQLTPSNGKFSAHHYGTKDGLSSNTIKGIIEDDSGDIWVSTNRGINCMNFDGGKVKTSTYNLHHGLQNYEFGEISATKTSSGVLIFGGVDGINYFLPNMFSTNPTPAIPIITDFKLEGRNVYNSDMSKEIPQGLSGKSGIRLRYNQNNFTLCFSALHMDNPERNGFEYQLEGWDRGWTKGSADVREVSYTNLSPGDYTFYLRVSNSDGLWTDNPLAIPIYIAPPFWQTIYAFIIYALLLLLLGFFIISYFHEMMERRNTLRIVNLERRKIEEMLELRTHFFTNISHEFRTPLTLVLSPLQSLLADKELRENERWAKLLNTMAHNGNSLMRLVNDFLSYTKQESGGLSATISRGDMRMLFSNLVEQFEFWAEQRGVRLTREICTEELMMDFDPYLIEQVLYNLVSNAIKNTPKGGEIRFSITREGEQSVLLSISDTGCGIPEHMKAQIFERYYSRTTESSRDIGGTGVGLYLSRSIVELHGGNIYFTSTEGEGTTFYVRLPQRIEGERIEGENTNQDIIIEPNIEISQTETADIATSTVDIAEAKEQNTAAATLLIVDDNSSLLLLLKDLFEGEYKILTAEDGEQALNVATQHLPDIIITDVMMPRMNGIELCREIKECDITSHIPVVMLSAKTSSNDLTAGYKVSADAYCAKPFNNEVLRETVNSLLQNRRVLASRFGSMSNNENDGSIYAEYAQSATTNTDKLFIKRLTEYVEENIHNQDLMVNDLCSYMGVTPLVLNKKLKSLLDMTANSLIRNIRLHKAATLLKTARYTIADVTYDVGFSDLRYFRECFKKKYGVLPQEYKEGQRPARDANAPKAE